MPQPAGEIVRPGQVVGKDLVSRNLVRRPVREALHVAQVGQDDRVVHLVHPRRVNPRHLEPVAARRVAGLDEEHLHAVAHAEHQPVGQAARKQDVLRADRIPHAGQIPVDEPSAEGRPVVGRIHPLEHHLSHGVGRTDDAALDGIRSHRSESPGRADQPFGAGAAAHGLRIERPDTPHVGHDGMRRKGRYLACHLVLEPHDHGHGQDHHCHAQCHGNHGDTLHHPGFVIRGVLRRPAGDEKGKVHGC